MGHFSSFLNLFLPDFCQHDHWLCPWSEWINFSFPYQNPGGARKIRQSEQPKYYASTNSNDNKLIADTKNCLQNKGQCYDKLTSPNSYIIFSCIIMLAKHLYWFIVDNFH